MARRWWTRVRVPLVRSGGRGGRLRSGAPGVRRGGVGGRVQGCLWSVLEVVDVFVQEELVFDGEVLVDACRGASGPFWRSGWTSSFRRTLRSTGRCWWTRAGVRLVRS